MTEQWTTDTLKTYIDSRFDSVREAITKAERQSELRDTKNNEFRAQLSDQSATFATRAEIDARITALEDKIASKSLQVMLSLGIGFTGVLIAVFNLATIFN